MSKENSEFSLEYLRTMENQKSRKAILPPSQSVNPSFLLSYGNEPFIIGMKWYFRKDDKGMAKKKVSRTIDEINKRIRMGTSSWLRPMKWPES